MALHDACPGGRMAAKTRILIVDDERDYTDVLRDRLVFEGFEVDVAYDGQSGFDRLVEMKPQIVLLDVMMPGLDGFEFQRRLREEGLDAVRVIFVTAYGRPISEDERTLIGDAPFIRKPFEVEDLLDLIQKLSA